MTPTWRPPEAALERKAEVERELSRGSFVAREEREVTFGVYCQRWLASRQISEARAYTDEGRARLHVLPPRFRCDRLRSPAPHACRRR